MKALGVLGTGSGAGKTWMTAALCAWLRGQGVRVAPFKAQNMSNNAWVTLDGGEMSRAQAMQAEACGRLPTVEMNPVLLKPSGGMGAQVIVLGRAEGHCGARDYYRETERLWRIVADTLEDWRSRCDVLVMEGAGSPVELNLMARDIANLRPIRHVDGRWLLVGDIDRGGIFAQLAGTWALLAEEDRARGLGAIVNRFRGDAALFPDPQSWLAPHAPGFRVLGTVPLRRDLQPEEEDGFSPADQDRGQGDTLAWVRTPHAANLTDCQPWWDDAGVRVRWTDDPDVLARARAIVLPGSKNTMADLRWLRAQGLDRVIRDAAAAGTLVVGICGGYQMLGERLRDPAGLAGDAGEEAGLGLLPVATDFHARKTLRATDAECDGERWSAYEIHMGKTVATGPCETLHQVWNDGRPRPEGSRSGRVWGTYLHGWFESPPPARAPCRRGGVFRVSSASRSLGRAAPRAVCADGRACRGARGSCSGAPLSRPLTVAALSELIFITGPVRSGKSRRAVEIARGWGDDVVFVATYRVDPDDAEMALRLRRHRAERPAWRTLEAPGDVIAALGALDPPPTGIVLDCLTLWASDRFDRDDAAVLANGALCSLCSAPRPCRSPSSADEIGWTPVPADPALRRFRDLLGWLGQRTAEAATEAWLLVAGCPVRLK